MGTAVMMFLMVVIEVVRIVVVGQLMDDCTETVSSSISTCQTTTTTVNGITVMNHTGNCCTGWESLSNTNLTCLCEAYLNSTNFYYDIVKDLPEVCNVSAPKCDSSRSLVEIPSPFAYVLPTPPQLVPPTSQQLLSYAPESSIFPVDAPAPYADLLPPSPLVPTTPQVPSYAPEESGPSLDVSDISPTFSVKTPLLAVMISIVAVIVGVGLLILYILRRKWRRNGIGRQNTNETFHASTNGSNKGEHIIVPLPVHSEEHPTSRQSCTQKNNGGVNMSSSSTKLSAPKTTNIKAFTFEELSEATNGFSNDNYIGKGGFGNVYKGDLSNGQVVAIKQLRAGSSQGEREFKAEIEVISRIHHRNLVSLVGYSIDKSQNMLVYEYLANNSLAYHLHARGAPTLAWGTRMQIALGSAKGFAYLHEDCNPKVIHRDIKATNILLDSNFKAKVSDFGLAKLIADAETHVTTRVVGTIGYFAPEYFESGKLTQKSDVYSFGVLLLELISGRVATDVVRWARLLLSSVMEDTIYDELPDPRLAKQFNKVEMGRMVACARACIQLSAQDRPRMVEVAQVLEGVMSPDDLYIGYPKGHYKLTRNILGVKE